MIDMSKGGNVDNKGVSLEVSRDVVREIVSTQISRQVLEALNGSERLIEELVHQVLSVKTTAEGQISQYPDHNEYNFVEVLCGQAIREKAKELIDVWIKENAAAIQAHIVKQLNKKRADIARSFVEAFISNTKNGVIVDVGIRPEGKSRREELLEQRIGMLENRLKGIEGKKTKPE